MLSSLDCRLCRILASLNYDGQKTFISPDSFIQPNFELVCDILSWFAQIVDDDQDEIYAIKEDLKASRHTELHQVTFLLKIGEFFDSKMQIQLDLVSLYRADIECCSELLRIAEPLYHASRLLLDSSDFVKQLDLSKRSRYILDTLKEIKDSLDQSISLPELSTTIKEVDEIVNLEQEFNEERTEVLNRRFSIHEIDKKLKDAYDGLIINKSHLERANEEFHIDLTRLNERLANKEAEIQVANERLNDLLIQSPAYRDKYQRLHSAYDISYEDYVSKFRNLCYLESCVYPQGIGDAGNRMFPHNSSSSKKNANRENTSDKQRVVSNKLPKKYDPTLKNLDDISIDHSGSINVQKTVIADELEGLLDEFVVDLESTCEQEDAKSDISDKDNLISDSSNSDDF